MNPISFGKEYSKIYDLLYADKDYQAEANYVSSWLRSGNNGASSILELGSGTGNHAKFLTEKGFIITGIEGSDEMIKKAKQKQMPGFEVMNGDIVDVSLDKRFDSAVALFHVMSYLDHECFQQCLINVSNHLKTGGLFLFDVWYKPAVLSLHPGKTSKMVQDHTFSVNRTATPELNEKEGRVKVCYTINCSDLQNEKTFQFIEEHNMWYYDIPHIDQCARIAGFELIRAEEPLSKKTPGTDTWGVCFILKKNA